MTSLTLNDLAIKSDHYDPATLLTDWAWRIGNEFSPIMPTSLGNVFLERSDGSIWLLDSWSGDILPVADVYDTFRTHVASDSEFVEHWFRATFVESLLQSGMERRPDQCFSPFVSPGLGGSLSPANFSVTSLHAHLATTSAESKVLHGGGSA